MPKFDEPQNYELAAEAAASLGRSGRQLRKKLDALRAFDAQHAHDTVQTNVKRGELVDEAAEALWGYVVQRELLGLQDGDRVRVDYAVPAEVWTRMGPKRVAGEDAGKNKEVK